MERKQGVITLLAAGFLAAALVLPPAVGAQKKNPAKEPVKKTQPAKQYKYSDNKNREWHISAGFMVGCYWWQPVWQKYIANDVSNGLNNFKYKMGPNAIYGPLLVFTANSRWSLSWSFQYARYVANARALITFPPLGIDLYPGKIRFAVSKMDSDLIALVSVSKYVRIFFGPRYQGYRYNEKFLMIKSSPVIYHSLSMGFGCALSVPLGANFYFLPNLSLVGLVGWEEFNPFKISYTQGSTALIAGAIGVNGVLNFGYYISSAGVTISAGFRAQYLYYIRKTRPSYGNKGDLFLGPSVAVTYTY